MSKTKVEFTDKTHLQGSHDPSVQVSLVRRVVWDGPATGWWKDGLTTDVESSAAIHLRELIQNFILKIFFCLWMTGSAKKKKMKITND